MTTSTHAPDCGRCHAIITSADGAAASLYDPALTVCTRCRRREAQHRGDIVPPTIALASTDARTITEHEHDDRRRPVTCLTGGERISHRGRVWTIETTVRHTFDEVVTLHLTQPGDRTAREKVPYYEGRIITLVTTR